MMNGNNNYGNHNQGFKQDDPNATELDIATDIMKRNPGMETWRALELAKRVKDRPSSTKNDMR